MQIKYSLQELENTVVKFWDEANHFKVIVFTGDLGAGKTTFITKLCKYLGVREVPSSPTFSIINEYIFEQNGKPKSIFHSDWYRLRDEEEAINAGVEDMLAQSDMICFVEWPEKAWGLVPKGALHVKIEWIDETTRSLTTKIID